MTNVSSKLTRPERRGHRLMLKRRHMNDDHRTCRAGRRVVTPWSVESWSPATLSPPLSSLTQALSLSSLNVIILSLSILIHVLSGMNVKCKSISGLVSLKMYSKFQPLYWISNLFYQVNIHFNESHQMVLGTNIE